jgi:hypothetical protein
MYGHLMKGCSSGYNVVIDHYDDMAFSYKADYYIKAATVVKPRVDFSLNSGHYSLSAHKGFQTRKKMVLFYNRAGQLLTSTLGNFSKLLLL